MLSASLFSWKGFDAKCCCPSCHPFSEQHGMAAPVSLANPLRLRHLAGSDPQNGLI